MKAKDLRTLPEGEARQKLTELSQQLADLRMKARSGSVEQPHRIRYIRRDIAKLHTVLHESPHLSVPAKPELHGQGNLGKSGGIVQRPRQEAGPSQVVG